MYKNLLRRVTASRLVPASVLMVGMVGMAYFEQSLGLATILAILSIVFLPPRLKYELGEQEQARWEALQSAWNAVFQSEKLCQIVPRGTDNAVDYYPATPKKLFPLPVRMNVEPPVLKLKDCYLSVLPDAVFITRDTKSAAYSHDQITVTIDAVGYLENGTLPQDAEIIGHRWLFLNSDGTPDKSRSDNVELPLVRYGRISVQWEGGQIQLICSNEKAAAALAEIIAKNEKP